MEKASDLGGGAARAVGQEFFQYSTFGVGEISPLGEFDHMDEMGAEIACGKARGVEILEEFLKAKLGEGRRAAKRQHGR